MATRRTTRLRSTDLPDWELKLVSTDAEDQLHARYLGADGFNATLVVDDVLTETHAAGESTLRAENTNVTVTLGGGGDADAWVTACAELLNALAHAALEMTTETRLEAEPVRRRVSSAAPIRGGERHGARRR